MKETRSKKVDWADNIRSLDDPATAYTNLKPWMILCAGSELASMWDVFVLHCWLSSVRRHPHGTPGGDMSGLILGRVMHKGTGLAYLAGGKNKYHITLNLELRRKRNP